MAACGPLSADFGWSLHQFGRIWRPSWAKTRKCCTPSVHECLLSNVAYEISGGLRRALWSSAKPRTRAKVALTTTQSGAANSEASAAPVADSRTSPTLVQCAAVPSLRCGISGAAPPEDGAGCDAARPNPRPHGRFRQSWGSDRPNNPSVQPLRDTCCAAQFTSLCCVLPFAFHDEDPTNPWTDVGPNRSKFRRSCQHQVDIDRKRTDTGRVRSKSGQIQPNSEQLRPTSAKLARNRPHVCRGRPIPGRVRSNWPRDRPILPRG